MLDGTRAQEGEPATPVRPLPFTASAATGGAVAGLTPGGGADIAADVVFAARRSRLAGLTSTPARLRVVSLLLVGGILSLWVVIAAFAAQRQAVAARALDRDGPQLVRAQNLYRVLADADATASRTLLESGEQEDLRKRYLSDLEQAADLVTVLATKASSDRWQVHLETINRGLSQYAGQVESSRTNSRLGFPVGAAYLRQASTLMREELLREATELYAMAAADLDESGRTGTAPVPWVALAIVGSALVIVLVLSQWWLARRTRRLVNMGLVALSALTVLLLGVTSWLLLAGQRSLVKAQQEGSDVVQLLASTRILTLQAHTDAGFTLIERGTGEAFVEDFQDVVGRIGVPIEVETVRGERIPHPVDGDPTGLLAALETIESSEVRSTAVAPTEFLLRKWLVAHQAVRSADAQGEYESAVRRFLTEEVQAALAVDEHLSTSIEAAQGRFKVGAGDARDFAAPLVALSTIAAIAGVAALALGLRPRFREYR
ncbi:MAG TPA: hypothetical protein VF855_11230 [Acidimicrobiales bacterium]